MILLWPSGDKAITAIWACSIHTYTPPAFHPPSSEAIYLHLKGLFAFN